MFQDCLAAVVAVGLLVVVAVLVVQEKAIPDVIAGAFGVAIGFIFGARGGARTEQVVEGLRQEIRNNGGQI